MPSFASYPSLKDRVVFVSGGGSGSGSHLLKSGCGGLSSDTDGSYGRGGGCGSSPHGSHGLVLQW